LSRRRKIAELIIRQNESKGILVDINISFNIDAVVVSASTIPKHCWQLFQVLDDKIRQK
jgi:hypothetical protein